MQQLMDSSDPDFTRSHTLLLVDDEEMILASLRRLLEEEPDMEVLTCTSALEALQLLGKQAVDVIISDMRMPGMDGATFLTQAAQVWPDTARILLTGYADIESTIQAINTGRISQYIAKPWDDDDFITRIREVLQIKHLKEHNQQLLKIKEEQTQQLKELTEKQESVIKNRTAELEQTAQQLDLAYHELQESYFQSVPLLANLIELNERQKKNHAKRVADITRVIAKDMDVDDRDLRQFYIGALLHDIGKIGIEQAILSKAPADLTNAERSRYQQHTLLGESALLSFDPLREAAQIVRCHHERYDGKGFPAKLSGEAIPLGARIVSLANDYDNLQSPVNFFGKALTEGQASDFILNEAGKRYDPAVVASFERCLDKLRELMSKDKEVYMPLEKVTPGMTLSQDLINHHGILMLAAGHSLTEAHITKLKQFEKAFDTTLKLAIKYVPPKEEQATG